MLILRVFLKVFEEAVQDVPEDGVVVRPVRDDLSGFCGHRVWFVDGPVLWLILGGFMRASSGQPAFHDSGSQPPPPNPAPTNTKYQLANGNLAAATSLRVEADTEQRRPPTDSHIAPADF